MTWITDAFKGINLTAEAAEKLTAMESQFKVLQRENVKLKLENQKLRAEVAELRLRNQKLHDEVTELRKTKPLMQPASE